MTAPVRLHNGRVTVVIPTYNRAHLLPRAIESVLRQTAAERCDVVLVDDGSTDDTPHIAAAYRERLLYVRQRNAGPSAARNAGVRACPNEFTAFLDADDSWVADKLELQLAVVARRSQAVLVGGRRWDELPSGERRLHGQPPVPFNELVDFAPALFEGNFLTTSTVLVRTQALLEAGLFPPRIWRSEDSYTWTRVACRGPGVYLPDPLAVYSVDTPDGLAGDQLKMLSDQLRVRHLLQSELRRRPDCRLNWRRGIGRTLVDLRDVAYRREHYALAARHALRLLLHEPWKRRRWEWARFVDAALRAAFGPTGRPHGAVIHADPCRDRASPSFDVTLSSPRITSTHASQPLRC